MNSFLYVLAACMLVAVIGGFMMSGVAQINERSSDGAGDGTTVSDTVTEDLPDTPDFGEPQPNLPVTDTGDDDLPPPAPADSDSPNTPTDPPD